MSDEKPNERDKQLAQEVVRDIFGVHFPTILSPEHGTYAGRVADALARRRVEVQREARAYFHDLMEQEAALTELRLVETRREALKQAANIVHSQRCYPHHTEPCVRCQALDPAETRIRALADELKPSTPQDGIEKLSDYTGEAKRRKIEEIRRSEKLSGQDLQQRIGAIDEPKPPKEKEHNASIYGYTVVKK